MLDMRSKNVVLIVVGIVVVAALAIHFFGGSLMSTLRSLHG
jgi:hypothetical protein